MLAATAIELFVRIEQMQPLENTPYIFLVLGSVRRISTHRPPKLRCSVSRTGEKEMRIIAWLSTRRLALIVPFALLAACDNGTNDTATNLIDTSGGQETNYYESLGLPPPWTAPAEFDCETAAPVKRSDVAGKPGGFWLGTLVDCVSGEAMDVLALIAQDGRFRIFSTWDDQSGLLSGTLAMDGDTFASDGKYFFSDGSGCAACPATSLFVTGFVSDRQRMEGRWTSGWGGYGYFVLDYNGLAYEDQISNIAWSTSLGGGWDGSRDDYEPIGVAWTVDVAGQVTGSDATGCAYDGAFALEDSRYNLFEGEITLSECADQGAFTGFAMKSSGPFNDRLWVSMDDGEHRAVRFFFLSR